MQTTLTGRRAEQAAAEHLHRLGYEVLDRNWRRRECEIDIIALRSGVAYFVEVKYRQNDTAGSGFDYITSRKLRRMEYAANRWVAENRWPGEYTLSAIEVDGRGFEVTAFVESIAL